MKTATYISDNGKQIFLGAKPPFMLRNITTNVGGRSIVSVAPLQDGQTELSTSLATRIILLTGSVTAYGNKKKAADKVLDEYVSELGYIFNPKIGGTLIIHTNLEDREIRCRPVATPALGVKNVNSRYLDIELIADYPYFESRRVYSSWIGFTKGTFKFPLTLPTTFGETNTKLIVNNTTPLDIAVRIEVSRTELDDIVVTNKTTGEFIAINKAIAADQKLIIDTKEKRADVYDSDGSWVMNATNWISLDSTWFKLVPGSNEITVNNHLATASPIAVLEYRLPYLEV